MFRAGSQTIENSTYTPLEFSDVHWDTDQMFDPSISERNKLTVNTPGLYLCIVQVRWAANATGIRQVFMEENGVQNFCDTTLEANTDSGIVTQHDAVGIWRFDAGDAIVARVFQNIDGGGSLSIVRAANVSPELMAVWLAPLP